MKKTRFIAAFAVFVFVVTISASSWAVVDKSKFFYPPKKAGTLNKKQPRAAHQIVRNRGRRNKNNDYSHLNR